MLYSIGDLARRTGLTVKTIRFYSDQGIVQPADRSPAGYRLYDIDAVARLDLVRTLRDLGIDLATIRKVVDREVSLPEVAAAHASALSAQISTLRLRRAVLTAVARRGSTPEEMELMHHLAKLSEQERQSLIGDFLDTVFGPSGTLAGIRRSMTPSLPDDPEPEQVEAWIELAELTQDPGFRALMRRLADRQRDHGLRPDVAAQIRDGVFEEYGGPAVEGLVAHMEDVNDPRRERYLTLLAVINGWPAPQSMATQIERFLQKVSAQVLPGFGEGPGGAVQRT